MHGFIKDGGIVGDVDNHGDFALPDTLPLAHKVVLEELCQLALAEGNHSVVTIPVSGREYV